MAKAVGELKTVLMLGLNLHLLSEQQAVVCIVVFIKLCHLVTELIEFIFAVSQTIRPGRKNVAIDQRGLVCPCKFRNQVFAIQGKL